jgi:hypothetical protein
MPGRHGNLQYHPRVIFDVWIFLQPNLDALELGKAGADEVPHRLERSFAFVTLQEFGRRWFDHRFDRCD